MGLGVGVYYVRESPQKTKEGVGPVVISNAKLPAVGYQELNYGVLEEPQTLFTLAFSLNSPSTAHLTGQCS